MAYYPIFVELKNKPCLVVGGGEIGLQKVRGLLAAEAQVTVVSPELHPTLAEWVVEGRIKHVARALLLGRRDGLRDRDGRDGRPLGQCASPC